VHHLLVSSSNNLWRPDPPFLYAVGKGMMLQLVFIEASDWLQFRQRSFVTIDVLLIHGIFLLPIKTVVQSTRRAFVSMFAYSSRSSVLSLYVDTDVVSDERTFVPMYAFIVLSPPLSLYVNAVVRDHKEILSCYAFPSVLAHSLATMLCHCFAQR
jgi:hypothetical protein